MRSGSKSPYVGGLFFHEIFGCAEAVSLPAFPGLGPPTLGYELPPYLPTSLPKNVPQIS